MDLTPLSLFGLFAVTLMLIAYALEHRSPWFVLLFAAACALGSAPTDAGATTEESDGAPRSIADREGIRGVWATSRSSHLGHPTRSILGAQAYGSCRSYAKRTERVSHSSLDGAGRRAAHRLHRPSSLVLIKKRNTPENGRHDVAKVAPDEAKTSGSLRAISDTEPFTHSIGASLDRRGGPLFSRSEARLPAESRQLGSLESRRTSSSRQTTPD
jgi:hypothetical protein